jgi:glycine cleavage system H protein
MDEERPNTLHYRRSRFVTHLPTGYLYSPSHAWLHRRGDGIWRVGITKFATRMLGDMVDHGFEVESGATLEWGRILGWVEGFKAISDLYSVVAGNFRGGNPALGEGISKIGKDPYRQGWLYEAAGEPDDKCMPVGDYVALLDTAIDRILAKEQSENHS